jgi:hypothetical protein
MERAQRAIEQAHEVARLLPERSAGAGTPRARRFAIGDPQAPLATFIAVLEHHGLLGEDGWLAPDVLLVSMGDHFDWGHAAEARQAAAEGLALLAWLAHHDEDQVVLLAGNDLGRLGELAAFDDAMFARMQQEAVGIYRNGDVDRDAERDFLNRWPDVPTAELVARDFAAFEPAQRDLVAHLLVHGQLHLAWAPSDDLLLLHAGVTSTQLQQLGIDPRGGATSIARGLERHLADAVRAWPGPPARFEIPGVHRPGNAISGEGDGVLYHRAAYQQKPRRFDPRDLPRGLVQAIGHVRDKKSRQLLGSEWTDGAAPVDGPLRYLVTDGTKVHYAKGRPQYDPTVATMLFLDGGMNYTAPASYELLTL